MGVLCVCAYGHIVCTCVLSVCMCEPIYLLGLGMRRERACNCTQLSFQYCKLHLLYKVRVSTSLILGIPQTYLICGMFRYVPTNQTSTGKTQADSWEDYCSVLP